ncbi:hypothetical protein [Streptomyces sp. CNQ085]|uniref:hypothetical protein n=1 Tax=Streptomyces sp. CNQ085 TaxID=2886944 RepID=UPI001F50E281|nr:hypothetical protein [Streptomyces sp. CNQ085]MCI0383796.1 hypothetical protein [Streptomyces sp. CNQ085]
MINASGLLPRTGCRPETSGDFSWRGARLFVRAPARTPGRFRDRDRPGGGNGHPPPAYRAEAVAVGAVGDGTVAVQLGACEAADRRRVLDWLREQARRIADGLDPDPFTARWAPGGALVPLPEGPAGAADAPAELRRWYEDEERQRAASELLARGTPFHLAVADHTGTYVLSARPVGAAAP